MRNIKKSIQFLFGIIFFFSCATISNHKSGNYFKMKRVGLMDTITINISERVYELYENFGLPGADIELSNKNNNYHSFSKEKGVFKFKNLLPGKYKIRSTYLGYFTFSDSIVLKSGEIIKLKIGLGTYY
ncbi:peptidase associated/transthyretin-like domain-containing protein [Polaribacter gochangensis]|uniref:hypothetical protein n=1 Tax=Polaribacter gochangensis TaxID=3252903 RepID=UPI003904B099